MTEKDIERIALETLAPYISNREEKIFLMNAAVLRDFIEKVNQVHREEPIRD